MPSILYPNFIPNAGVKMDTPDQFLAEQYMAENSRNMIVKDDTPEGFLGMSKLHANALPDRIMHMDLFKDFDQNIFPVICTQKDVVYYDRSADKPIWITPQYNTGTATFVNGSTTVEFSGTDFVTAEIKAGDMIRLGTLNADNFEDQVWYEIDSVTDLNTLELTVAYAEANSGAGATYSIRKTFTGGTRDYWDTASFTDNTLGKILVFTNGTDVLHYWDGSDQLVVLGGSPPLCKYLAAYKDHLFLAWCVVSGDNQPQQIQWCAAGNAESYPATFLEYLVDTPGEITGIKKVGNYLMAGKEDSIYQGRYVDPDITFDFELKDSGRGVFSHWSMVEILGGVVFYADDQRFHFWNGISSEALSSDILPYTREFQPTLHRYIQGIKMPHLKQVRWIVPYSDTDEFNAQIILDYDKGRLFICDGFPANMLNCYGSYEQLADLYVDEAPWATRYVDEQVGFWDERAWLANAPLYLIGGVDGYIRTVDDGTDYDGTEYTRKFVTKNQDYRRPDVDKGLLEIRPWLRKQTNGTVSYRCRVSDEDSFSVTKTFDHNVAGFQVAKLKAKVGRTSDVFQHEFSATVHFELLGYHSKLKLLGQRK